MVFSFLFTRKRSRRGDDDQESSTQQQQQQQDDDDDNNDWKVERVAAKDAAQRKREGGSFRSPPIKTACDSLQLEQQGAVGTILAPRSILFFARPWRTTTTRTIVDFNHYRSGGHAGRFTAKTQDRAISIATTAAYAKLAAALQGKAEITHGDLGENILIKGCSSATENAESGLYVGAQIAIGETAVLEITEANNPCYRFNTQPWAETAKQLWGDTVPNGGEANQWFKSPQCPLNHTVFPGVRGWLARVITEGIIKPGDTARVINRGVSSKGNEALCKDDAMPKRDNAPPPPPPPPSKRRKTKP